MCETPEVSHTTVIGSCPLMQMRHLTHVPFGYLDLQYLLTAEKWVQILNDSCEIAAATSSLSECSLILSASDFNSYQHSSLGRELPGSLSGGKRY